MKVALFGGSFNPIHKGHLEIAKNLLNKDIVDRVWFIPCGNHAFDKKLANAKDRIKMLNLSIKNNPKLKVIDIEILSENVSFTSKTIKTLQNKFSEIEFNFIIGADNLTNMDKWHNFEYLKKNIKFILVKRPGFESINDLGINIISILEMENEISSTTIRNLLNNCKSIKNLVPKKVEEYIKKGGLYHDRS